MLYPTVVEEHGLDLYVTRGFSSVTYLQSAAEFIKRDGRTTYVYLLTDFDPSGLKIAETVGRELVERAAPVSVEIERLAVTQGQIASYTLPTRPTKTTDTRARAFVAQYGTNSVELDALPPDALRELVRKAIERHMDKRQLHSLKMAEREERHLVAAFGNTWRGE